MRRAAPRSAGRRSLPQRIGLYSCGKSAHWGDKSFREFATSASKLLCLSSRWPDCPQGLKMCGPRKLVCWWRQTATFRGQNRVRPRTTPESLTERSTGAKPGTISAQVGTRLPIKTQHPGRARKCFDPIRRHAPRQFIALWQSQIVFRPRPRAASLSKHSTRAGPRIFSTQVETRLPGKK